MAKRPENEETLEATAALLVKATKERDEARDDAALLRLQLEDEQGATTRLREEFEKISAALAELDGLAARTTREANVRIANLLAEAGEGNGASVEWLALAKHAEDDYRVLRLTTPGVPPRATAGEKCMDREEAEFRFKVEVA